jgi:hypothetical protein
MLGSRQRTERKAAATSGLTPLAASAVFIAAQSAV